eukprot:Pgem_evm1s6983
MKFNTSLLIFTACVIFSKAESQDLSDESTPSSSSLSHNLQSIINTITPTKIETTNSDDEEITTASMTEETTSTPETTTTSMAEETTLTSETTGTDSVTDDDMQDDYRRYRDESRVWRCDAACQRARGHYDTRDEQFKSVYINPIQPRVRTRPYIRDRYGNIISDRAWNAT